MSCMCRVCSWRGVIWVGAGLTADAVRGESVRLAGERMYRTGDVVRGTLLVSWSIWVAPISR